MTQPTPALPINVQSNNPYAGLDRGLFLYRDHAVAQYARVHSAKWVSQGPSAAVGVFEFQLMGYARLPVTAADYAAGTLLRAPDGSTTFDCLARRPVLTPITAEYWGKQSYIENFSTDTPEKLLQIEKDNVNTQARMLLNTMVKALGINSLTIETDFACVAGQALTKTSTTLTFNYTKNGQTHDYVLTTFPSDDFDPVRMALQTLKTL